MEAVIASSINVFMDFSSFWIFLVGVEEIVRIIINYN